jgi:hypothetical protein
LNIWQKHFFFYFNYIGARFIHSPCSTATTRLYDVIIRRSATHTCSLYEQKYISVLTMLSDFKTPTRCRFQWGILLFWEIWLLLIFFDTKSGTFLVPYAGKFFISVSLDLHVTTLK